jgi:hypothetical protein
MFFRDSLKRKPFPEHQKPSPKIRQRRHATEILEVPFSWLFGHIQYTQKNNHNKKNSNRRQHEHSSIWVFSLTFVPFLLNWVYYPFKVDCSAKV